MWTWVEWGDRPLYLCNTVRLFSTPHAPSEGNRIGSRLSRGACTWSGTCSAVLSSNRQVCLSCLPVPLIPFPWPGPAPHSPRWVPSSLSTRFRSWDNAAPFWYCKSCQVPHDRRCKSSWRRPGPASTTLSLILKIIDILAIIICKDPCCSSPSEVDGSREGERNSVTVSFIIGVYITL